MIFFFKLFLKKIEEENSCLQKDRVLQVSFLKIIGPAFGNI